jgi:hypothetical protein
LAKTMMAQIRKIRNGAQLSRCLGNQTLAIRGRAACILRGGLRRPYDPTRSVWSWEMSVHSTCGRSEICSRPTQWAARLRIGARSRIPICPYYLISTRTHEGDPLAGGRGFQQCVPSTALLRPEPQKVNTYLGISLGT